MMAKPHLRTNAWMLWNSEYLPDGLASHDFAIIHVFLCLQVQHQLIQRLSRDFFSQFDTHGKLWINLTLDLMQQGLPCNHAS